MPLQQRRLFIENFVWHSDRPFDFCSAADLRDAELVLPSLSGQFAVHLTDGRKHLLARDPLGVHKLFFAVNGSLVESSNYLLELLQRGHRIDQISSVPSGHAVFIDAEARTGKLAKYSGLQLNQSTGRENGDLDECAESIRSALHAAFCRIRQAALGRPVYVTMSGGLDSTVIALLARDYLVGVHGLTLQVVSGDRSESEDVQFARMVARDLGIPLTAITVTPEEIVGQLDEVLMWGQDWRDFNVHCGLVNAALGRAVMKRAAPEGRRPLFLTGDTMNELMADYAPVRYRGRELYPLPRLNRGQLRRSLVTGLDTGDREIGILAKMGFSVIQAYAMCADAYLSVPAGFLEEPDAKQELARRIMGDRIPEYVLNRPKVRAQAANATDIGGTLAVLLDAGLDQQFLSKRWCELFGLPLRALGELIRAGVYKFSIDMWGSNGVPRRAFPVPETP